MTAAERKVRERYPRAFALKIRRGDWRIRRNETTTEKSLGWGRRAVDAWNDAAENLPILTPASAEQEP